ncbi:MAG: B12-binding domain-containing radical SAM protein [Magnetococcales bacterium]|nr:B12-binding domain-containing radical SAM protein [Magnetococcales bacterium]
MKIERVLLIDVELDKSDGEYGQLQGRWTHHPLGLMYLVSSARAVFADLEFKIIHTATCKDSGSEILSAIKTFKPQLVGLRSLAIFRDRFDYVAKLIRNSNPEIILIGGGPYPNGYYEFLLENKLLDLVVIEEGETTFTKLISLLRGGTQLPSDLPGTAILNSNGKVTLNTEATLIQDLDSIPFPAYDLIDLNQYSDFSNHSFQNTSSSAFIYSTRGCPYRCFYCSAANTKKVRKRSAENIVEEMSIYYHERGIREFVFVDDIFNVPLSKSKNILNLIGKKLPGVKLNFSNGLRADIMDKEFIDLLREVGTAQLCLAVETATPRLQKMIGKYLNLEKAHELINEASKHIVTGVFFMVGFPSETEEEAFSTIKYATTLQYMAQPIFSVVRVYQDTPLFDFLKPSAKQIKQLREQSSKAVNTKMMENESENFYGDFFDNDLVPLNSKLIRELRWEWYKSVVMSEQRLSKSHSVLQKHYDKEQILSFYKNFFDNPNLDEKYLTRLLNIKSIM